ncbi:MAG TPA: hypothetical protein VIV40_32170 [Kofleriaceae bacterium]
MPAGTYHFVLDCIVIADVDMRFELLHRRGTADSVVTTWNQHFNPLSISFDAQAYELDQTGAAIDFTAGDLLVFRFSAENTIQSDAWIPNGDGNLSHGRIPNFTLPK